MSIDWYFRCYIIRWNTFVTLIYILMHKHTHIHIMFHINPWSSSNVAQNKPTECNIRWWWKKWSSIAIFIINKYSIIHYITKGKEGTIFYIYIIIFINLKTIMLIVAASYSMCNALCLYYYHHCGLNMPIHLYSLHMYEKNSSRHNQSILIFTGFKKLSDYRALVIRKIRVLTS